MRRACGSKSIWRICCSCSLLTLLLVAPVEAQKPAGKASPKYDLQTESKIKGLVEELKFPEAANAKEEVHLLIKNGDDTIDVLLCPKSFLDDMGFTLAKGSAVEITASKVKQDGVELVLARDVAIGNDKLMLRDGKGNPVWNWHR